MYEIWHDNDFDLAHWLYLNSTLKNHQVTLRQIPKTNNPKDLQNHLKKDSDLSILKAIKYETPDIVIQYLPTSGPPEIKLVIEFMTHVPQHHHPLQRFTRIYGSAWQGIPSVLVIPAKKEKLEKGQRDSYKPTMYKANPLIYHLFIKTTEITGTPTLLMMWPEVNGYLKYDKTHPTSPFIEGDIVKLIEILNNLINKQSIEEICKSHLLSQKRLSDYKAEGNSYKLTTGKSLTTKELLKKFEKSIDSVLGQQLLERHESYLFSPNGLKREFRTDPYAGMTCAFDILFCRDETGLRKRNLILHANQVTSKDKKGPTLIKDTHNEEKCPFVNPMTLKIANEHFLAFCPYTERKQQRIYGTVPDLVIYEDGNIYVP